MRAAKRADRRTRERARRGAALIELAIVLPMAVMMVGVGMDGSALARAQLEVDAAAAEAARYVASDSGAPDAAAVRRHVREAADSGDDISVAVGPTTAAEDGYEMQIYDAGTWSRALPAKTVVYSREVTCSETVRLPLVGAFTGLDGVTVTGRSTAVWSDEGVLR